jgi:hypothetical protein
MITKICFDMVINNELPRMDQLENTSFVKEWSDESLMGEPIRKHKFQS